MKSASVALYSQASRCSCWVTSCQVTIKNAIGGTTTTSHVYTQSHHLMRLGIILPGKELAFHFIQQVFNKIEVSVLCRPFEFLQT